MAQFTLYSHQTGPNGWKVALILESLGLPYDTKFLDFERQEHKQEDFLKINPNGRIPALVENGDDNFTLWESGAIIDYLCEEYDPEYLITPKKKKDRMRAKQWLFFQASGQGPYFGQAVYSKKSGQDFNMTAVKRFEDEAKRVVSVLDAYLKNRKWLVGNKPSFADLSFYPWNAALETHIFPGEDFLKNFAPNVSKWMDRMSELPAVKKVLRDQEQAISALLQGGAAKSNPANTEAVSVSS